MIKIKNIFKVIGLGYGDEGKGSIVDYLVREYGVHTIVRFNGGSQAAHHVVTPDGITHCFSQFGSGTFVPEVKTYLSRHMLVDPIGIGLENNDLKSKGVKDGIERLFIDSNCSIITPFHKILSRMLEVSRGDSRRGSCGKGVGQAVKDRELLRESMLFAGDLCDKEIINKKLKFLWHLKIDIAEQLVDKHKDNDKLLEYLINLKQNDYVERLVDEYHRFSCGSGVKITKDSYLKRVLERDGNVIFEGAQGILLDNKRGFWPYVTSTNTTFQNADELIHSHNYNGNVRRIGVIRAYSTRHGNGPFVTEDEYLTRRIPDIHNSTNEWQGVFRVGWFDLLIAKYSLEVVNSVDCIALTNIDRLHDLDEIKVCTSYRHHSSNDSLNGIKVRRFTTIEHQKRLTELLNQYRPIYRSIKLKKFNQFLEKELSVPISIISEGPKASDKIQIKPLY